MLTRVLTQPRARLGDEFLSLFSGDSDFVRIQFVSAFTRLRTILRLRERMLEATARGTTLRMTLGIDLGGTSKEVLEELLHWNCQVSIFHNLNPRSVFHPKAYFFESRNGAIAFVGSNNLTDGGLYTNYEAATRMQFTFPEDREAYAALCNEFNSFLEPTGPTVRLLDAELIGHMDSCGMLPSERDIRMRRMDSIAPLRSASGTDIPFSLQPCCEPPLLPKSARDSLKAYITTTGSGRERHADSAEVQLVKRLVWRKVLPKTDVLDVAEGANPVGGVRLTQAKYRDQNGSVIDQTTYFRKLFDEYEWEHEPGKRSDQEHTFIPVKVVIRGTDYGCHNLEVSHKPSGEAGQRNYTTILRWGHLLSRTIRNGRLAGSTLLMYETNDPRIPFIICIG